MKMRGIVVLILCLGSVAGHTSYGKTGATAAQHGDVHHGTADSMVVPSRVSSRRSHTSRVIMRLPFRGIRPTRMFNGHGYMRIHRPRSGPHSSHIDIHSSHVNPHSQHADPHSSHVNLHSPHVDLHSSSVNPHAHIPHTNADTNKSPAHPHQQLANPHSTHVNTHTSHADSHSAHANPHTSHVDTHSTHANPHTSHADPHSAHVDPHTSHVDTHSTHANLHTSHADPHSAHVDPHTSHVDTHSTHANLHTSHADPHSAHVDPKPSTSASSWKGQGFPVLDCTECLTISAMECRPISDKTFCMPRSSGGSSHGDHHHHQPHGDTHTSHVHSHGTPPDTNKAHKDSHDHTQTEGFPVHRCSECRSPMECRNIRAGKLFCMPPSSRTTVSSSKSSRKGPARCYERRDKGTCRSNLFTRYYFDPRRGRCRRFTWSGCGGNRNRFSRLRDCRRTCMSGRRSGRRGRRGRRPGSSSSRNRMFSFFGMNRGRAPWNLRFASSSRDRSRRPSNGGSAVDPATDSSAHPDHAHFHGDELGIHGI